LTCAVLRSRERACVFEIVKTQWWPSQWRKKSILNCLLSKRQSIIQEPLGWNMTNKGDQPGWELNILWAKRSVGMRDQTTALSRIELYGNVTEALIEPIPWYFPMHNFRRNKVTSSTAFFHREPTGEKMKIILISIMVFHICSI